MDIAAAHQTWAERKATLWNPVHSSASANMTSFLYKNKSLIHIEWNIILTPIWCNACVLDTKTQRKALNYTREDISVPNIYCLHYWVKLFWAIAQLIVDLMTGRFKDSRSSRMQTRPQTIRSLISLFCKTFWSELAPRIPSFVHRDRNYSSFSTNQYGVIWGAKSWSNPNILFL